MIWLGNDFLISGLLRQVERADAGDDGGSCWRSSLWPHTQVKDHWCNWFILWALLILVLKCFDWCNLMIWVKFLLMFSTTDYKIANPGRWGSGRRGRWCTWHMRVISDDQRSSWLILNSGELFLRMLKALILPLVVPSLITAVGSLDMSLSGKVRLHLPTINTALSNWPIPPGWWTSCRLLHGNNGSGRCHGNHPRHHNPPWSCGTR